MTPSGWTCVPLSQVAEVNPKRPITKGAIAPFVEMAAVRVDLPHVDYISEREFTGSGSKFQNGDTLFARITPCAENGKTAYVDSLPPHVSGHGSTEFIVLGPRPGMSDGRFLYYLAKSDLVRSYAIGQMEGTSGRQRVPARVFDELILPIPPLPEQKKIAAILGSMDDAIQATQAVIDQTRKVKAGLLQQLLTRGLNNPPLVETDFGPRPSHWMVLTLGDVVEESRYGTSAKCESTPAGMPVLRIPNVVSGKVNFDDLKFTRLEDAEISRLRLLPGDILVVRTNGNPEYVGRAAVVPEHEGTLLYASYLIRLRLNGSRAVPKYIGAVLSDAQTRRFLGKTARTSAGNFNVNGTELASIPLALPPLEEQESIVEVLEVVNRQVNEAELTLTTLDTLKRGLMADLLSGRTRVEVPA